MLAIDLGMLSPKSRWFELIWGIGMRRLWMTRWSRLGTLALLVVGTLALVPASAAGAVVSASSHVSIAAPSQISPGGTVLVTGRVGAAGKSAHAELQLRQGTSWRAVSNSHLNSGRYLLSWRAPRRREVLLLRVVAVARRKSLAVSVIRRLRIRPGAPTTAGSSGGATVVAPKAVRSVPAPNSDGSVVIAGDDAVAQGSVLAVSVGPNTPSGFLGMVESVVHRGGETVVRTVPTTIEAALPEGSFDLANAQRVQTAQSASHEERLGPSARTAGDDDGGALNQDLSKSIACQGGATFSAKGTVGLSAKPKLSVSWSLFHGITASFVETVTASASLSGEVSAAGDCAFRKTGLLAHPAELGTFVGDVFGVPVVVSIQGQVYIEGDASAHGSVTAGVSGQASASGGIAYSRGKASVISPTTSLRFGATGPTLNASASVGAHVTPELQVLLYGVGGPVFDATTGLDLSADIHGNPWWALTAPLTLTASLQAPPLGLSTPDLTLYSHTFDIAHASGPFSPPTPQPPITPQPPHVPSSGATLVYDGDTAVPPEEEENPGLEGDRSFSAWSGATGQAAEVTENLPVDLSAYRCVALLANDSLSEAQQSALTVYLHEGGTLVAIGEHEGYGTADETLTRFAQSVGAGVSLNDDYHDYGPSVTSAIYPSPLTEGVFFLGDNWVSTVNVFGSAVPLVGTADGEGVLVAEQTLGAGTFIMSGDSNLFSDNSASFYEEDDNGHFVRDICP
jgi:hypothetical protein